MPSKKPPQGGKSTQQSSNVADNMAPADRAEGLALEEEGMSLMLEKISDKILSVLNERFDKLEATFQVMQATQQELSDKIDAVEGQTNDHEARIVSLEDSLNTLHKENKMLKSKLNDLEGRSRRNNIRLIGIPEGVEKGRPTEFVAELIKQLFADFSDPPVIDRAHRVPQPKPAEGARPRAIIARIHYYQDKERILRLRRGRELDYQGHKVLIFPKYTAEVVEQRRSFSEVIRSLQELKVGYFLRFPAKLCIAHNGVSKLFTSPTEAKLYVEKELKQSVVMDQN